MNWLTIASITAALTCAATPENKVEKNKEIVRRLFEDGVNTGKLEIFDQLVSEDYVGPNGEKGVAGFRGIIAGLRKGIPDIHYTIEDCLGDGDRVALRWTWRGTHTGMLRNIPPSNRPIQDTGIAIFELRDAKILKSWIQTDRLGVLQQIGLVPKDIGAPPK